MISIYPFIHSHAYYIELQQMCALNNNNKKWVVSNHEEKPNITKLQKPYYCRRSYIWFVDKNFYKNPVPLKTS